MRRTALLLTLALGFVAFAGVILARRIARERAAPAPEGLLEPESVLVPRADEEQARWVLERVAPAVPPSVAPTAEATTLARSRERHERFLSMTSAELRSLSRAELDEARTALLRARVSFAGEEGLTPAEKALRLAEEGLTALEDDVPPDGEHDYDQTAGALEDVGADEAASLYLAFVTGASEAPEAVRATAITRGRSACEAFTRACLKAGTCLQDLGLGEAETVARFPSIPSVIDGGDELFLQTCDAAESSCGIHAVRKSDSTSRVVVADRGPELDAIALGAEELVWVEDTTLLAAPRAGGTIRALATFAAGASIDSVAVDGEDVWFSVSRYDPTISTSRSSVISVMPLKGPPPADLKPWLFRDELVQRLLLARGQATQELYVHYAAVDGVAWFAVPSGVKRHLPEAQASLWSEGDETIVLKDEAPTAWLSRVHRVTLEETQLTPYGDWAGFARIPTGFIAVRDGSPVEVRIRDGARALRTLARFGGIPAQVLADDSDAWLVLGSEEGVSRLIRIPWARRLEALRTADRGGK